MKCGRRFTTVEEAVLAVVKRSGVTEPFSRDKVVSGVRRACQGRPVDEDALAQLAAGGDIEPHEATQLDDRHRFLRTVQHRLQLQNEQQTPTVPADPPRRQRIAGWLAAPLPWPAAARLAPA